jgi:hypothetical protein
MKGLGLNEVKVITEDFEDKEKIKDKYNLYSSVEAVIDLRSSTYPISVYCL